MQNSSTITTIVDANQQQMRKTEFNKVQSMSLKVCHNVPRKTRMKQIFSSLVHLLRGNGASKSIIPAARAYSELDGALRPLPGLCHHIPHGKVVPRESDRHRLGLPRLEHHVREALENRRWLSRGSRMVHVQLRNLIVCVLMTQGRACMRL